MKKFLILIAILFAFNSLSAQYIYTIKADSVKITNNCDTAELILENHTQNILGFLYNKGQGRTEFRKVVRLNDSTLVFGGDTLIIRGNKSAINGLSVVDGNIELGQAVGASGNPANLVHNTEIPLNNNALALTGNGSFLVGSSTNTSEKMQVTGTVRLNSLAGSGTRMVVANPQGVLSTQAAFSTTVEAVSSASSNNQTKVRSANVVVYNCDVSAGNLDLIIGTSTIGQLVYIKKIDPSANTISIYDTNFNGIDNKSPLVIDTRYECVTLAWNGSDYVVVGYYNGTAL